MNKECDKCPYKAKEFSSGGYGMPVREKEYCKLEKEHKPCEKVEDLPNDSYKPKEIGA
jgi:hypothetical protein